MKMFCKYLYFKSFLHIEDPDVVFLKDQSVSPLIKYVWIHLVQSEGCADMNLHNNFRVKTLFISFKDLRPKPPSCFGKQTTSHATFVIFAFKKVPDQKNAEHRLLISLIHCPRSLKPVI